MGWSIHHPVGLIHYTPAACQRGYTLFSTTRGGRDAYLIDMNGNVVHRWHSDEGIHYAYLLFLLILFQLEDLELDRYQIYPLLLLYLDV